MKAIITSILIFISTFLCGQNLPNVDIISTRQSDLLEVKLSSDAYFDEILSSLVFTIKWDNTISEDLGNINIIGQYPISPSGDIIVDGIYSYRIFVGFGFSQMAEFDCFLSPNVPYVLGFFDIDSNGLYEIINDDITNAYNGDYYISLNGEDRTRNIINEVSTAIQNELPIIDDDYGLVPNPFKDSFEVRSNSEPNVIQILDLSGKIIYESNIFRNKTPFDTSKLSPGQYFIRIIFDNDIVVLKGSKI